MSQSDTSQSRTNLWPSDIRPQEFLSPREILANLGRQLEGQMNGLLVGETIDEERADRVVLRFDIVSVKEDTRIKLFEIHHRKEIAYPAALIPPSQELPDYLASEVYRPAISDILKIGQIGISDLLKQEGHWKKNEWIAATPIELNKLLKTILATPVVKAMVVSLLSEVAQEERGGMLPHDNDV